jgi:hypothetical protein
VATKRTVSGAGEKAAEIEVTLKHANGDGGNAGCGNRNDAAGSDLIGVLHERTALSD